MKMNDREFIRQLVSGIDHMDAKSLFGIGGACMVEINRRIKEGKIRLVEN
jgi:hypothetical protein